MSKIEFLKMGQTDKDLAVFLAMELGVSRAQIELWCISLGL